MNTLKKGFTVLETLIVAILIGIICAVAFPAVNQYQATRAQAVMQDDGSRLGATAQTYFAETFTRSVTLGYNSATGAISGPEAFNMPGGNKIAAGYEIPAEFTIEMNKTDSFVLKHAKGGTYTFDGKGDLTKTQE